MHELKLLFTNKKTLDEFVSFMDNQGEQDWWAWEECRDLPQTDVKYDKVNKTITFTSKD